MSAGEVIHVNLGDQHGYDILVRPGILRQAGEWLRENLPSGKAAIVTDSNVADTHGKVLSESLSAAGITPIVAVIPAGEKHKNLHHLLPVYDQILSAKIERSTPLLAVGGGVVGDMGGFAAATILRGIPFVQVPTTLLAMVDASIGGKTGVDHAAGKNLIGAFWQPRGVLIDPGVLATLPPREFRSGLAECIKHNLIRDAAAFAEMEKDIDRIIGKDADALTDLIAHNARIKARVVEADPLEKGERAHLNFGHTFGHAIESVSGFSYSHGESVALGMTAAAFVSRELKLIDEPSRLRIVKIIQNAGLPTGGLSLDVPEITAAMKFDKKVKAGKIRFVLLDGIGRAVVRDDVPPELVQRAVESLRG
jgi:3-dehydroquinate synthase